MLASVYLAVLQRRLIRARAGLTGKALPVRVRCSILLKCRVMRESTSSSERKHAIALTGKEAVEAWTLRRRERRAR
jgi:hypothetical protein